MPKIERIHGTNGNDFLDGVGTAAFMSGGRGDDVYRVDNPGTVINEKNSGGIDEVLALIDWILGKNVENLTLEGNDDLSGTGNDDANVLTGNDGSNLLSGLDGDDTLWGGDGDDRLEGGVGADLLDGGAGFDTAGYSGNFADYSFFWSGSDLLVTDSDGITDTVRETEQLSFADMTVATDDLRDPEPPLPTADPVAVSDSLTGEEDRSVTIDVLRNDLGEGISLLAVGEGLKGGVSINADGTVTYTPNENAFGEDRFTYSIVDANGRTSEAEVILNIEAINDAPVAEDDGYSTDQETALDGVSVLANDSDADGDLLTVNSYDNQSALGGSVTMNSDGSFRYVPPIGVTGSDSFAYTTDDGQGGQASATVTIDIAPVNAAPDVADDNYSATAGVPLEGASVLANDTDPDGDALSVIAYDTESTFGGTVSMNADGTFVYLAPDETLGNDTFTYTVGDGQGGETVGTVVIGVQAPPNEAPIANADVFSGTIDTALSGNALANDSDPEADPLVVVAFDGASSAGGTIEMQPDGSFIYTPPPQFTGSDSFSYTVADGQGGEASADVTVDVMAAPVEEEVPYYVEGMLAHQEWQRLNYPDEIGTAITVTYTFLTDVPDYYWDPDAIRETFQSFSAEQRGVTRDILESIEDFANITFVEVANADEATITFGVQDFGGSNTASAFYPNGNSTGDQYGDIWLDDSLAASSFEPGTETHATLMHEIGHVMGLTHPTLPAAEATEQYSVMDAASHPDGHLFEEGPSGYQMYDIAALQHLYGANDFAHTADDVYSFAELDGRMLTIWDGGGRDTIDMSAADRGVTINLQDGSFSTVAGAGDDNIGIAYGTDIEDVIGGAHDDLLIGNELDNQFTGGDGADHFAIGTPGGTDTVTDFVRGEDRLDFTGTEITWEDLLIEAVEGGVNVSYDGGSIMVQDVDDVIEEDLFF